MKKIVFISHITEEKELALVIKHFIEEAFIGIIEVFVSSDEKSVSLGEKWLNNITDALENCCIELVLCSPISINKPWINFEAGAGWIRKIPVIPLCHSGIEPSKLPLLLNLLQAAKLSELSSLKLLLPVLSKAISSTEPKYDFTELISKVNEFEKQYTFWKECNRIFNEINRFNNQIIPALKTGKTVTIPLTEVDIRVFENLIPFLKSNDILDFRRIGGVSMGPNGTFYNCHLIPLNKLDTTFADISFKI
ncbi:toll/interleukin-1 receptor domain-containing protein [Leptospira levettii]|uniref:Toll/interleukin-1 receptor domain-containing protein n=1 Tax=Leptospira levettii TaxID=2023178 RepID=A0AAW5V628_9LEPT|nr:toll/interleukin-1 receptor domain-containing protein [Leptospira levettii]MCW7467682.1 toll/interleukin-1 receptor domain-containing protein [Leptospira levettii]MCW7513362.1 toll/interleukin-1 receptor domain-containing protein [Leptospira levettii]MCW7517085.1 toll/interleukin-1 receptor domain-containing protein [Leptospira levettii]